MDDRAATLGDSFSGQKAVQLGNRPWMERPRVSIFGVAFTDCTVRLFSITLNIYPARITSASSSDYFNPDFDKMSIRLWHVTVPNITYRHGPLDMGVICTLASNHSGGEGLLIPPTVRQQREYADTDQSYGGVYLKYYTGLLFLNLEADWFHQTRRRRKKRSGGGPALNIFDDHVEHWRWMAEGALLVGPARIALIYGWSSGGDRRNGRQIDRNGILADDRFSNTGLYLPYSYLQVYSYGLGMFINSTTGNGYVEDASVAGARLDYALAANLNIFGALFQAVRASASGFGWGCIRPNTAARDGSVILDFDRVGAPSIPDSDLGWEVNLGVNWQLLRDLTIQGVVGCWQPGNWYKFACIDKSVVNWAGAGVPGSANPADWGINPSRTIDPIWGADVIMSGSF